MKVKKVRCEKVLGEVVADFEVEGEVPVQDAPADDGGAAPAPEPAQTEAPAAADTPAAAPAASAAPAAD